MRTLIAFLMITVGTTATASTTVAMNDPGILYSPYNWNVSSVSAQTINSGAYFRTVFFGTTISLTFDTSADNAPYPQLWARLDGDGWQQYSLTAGNPTWAIGTGLQNRKHSVEVIVKSTTETLPRWGSSQTMVTITGIVLDTGAAVYAPIRRSKNVLIYGDSITEGVRTVNNTATNDTDRNDVLSDYSYGLSTAMDAEVGIVAFGGQGLTTTGSGSVPALTSSWNLIYFGVSRTFSPLPDLVIYNMGTNDTPGTAVTTALLSVLSNLTTTAPNAKQVVLRPFGGYNASYLQAAVTAANNSKITYVDTTGWFNSSDSSDGVHPYGYEHLQYIAPKLFPIAITALYLSINAGFVY